MDAFRQNALHNAPAKTSNYSLKELDLKGPRLTRLPNSQPGLLAGTLCSSSGLPKQVAGNFFRPGRINRFLQNLAHLNIKNALGHQLGKARLCCLEVYSSYPCNLDKLLPL